VVDVEATKGEEWNGCKQSADYLCDFQQPMEAVVSRFKVIFDARPV
jgi:hypothetical protein